MGGGHAPGCRGEVRRSQCVPQLLPLGQAGVCPHGPHALPVPLLGLLCETIFAVAQSRETRPELHPALSVELGAQRKGAWRRGGPASCPSCGSTPAPRAWSLGPMVLTAPPPAPRPGSERTQTVPWPRAVALRPSGRLGRVPAGRQLWGAAGPGLAGRRRQLAGPLSSPVAPTPTSARSLPRGG